MPEDARCADGLAIVMRAILARPLMTVSPCKSGPNMTMTRYTACLPPI